jgi:hypothetical protein
MTLLDRILRVGATWSVGVFLALWCGLRSAFDMVCLDQLEAGYFFWCVTHTVGGKSLGVGVWNRPKGPEMPVWAVPIGSAGMQSWQAGSCDWLDHPSARHARQNAPYDCVLGLPYWCVGCTERLNMPC